MAKIISNKYFPTNRSWLEHLPCHTLCFRPNLKLVRHLIAQWVGQQGFELLAAAKSNPSIYQFFKNIYYCEFEILGWIFSIPIKIMFLSRFPSEKFFGTKILNLKVQFSFFRIRECRSFRIADSLAICINHTYRAIAYRYL